MPPVMEAYMGVLGVNAVGSTQYFWIEEVEVSYWIIIEDCTDNQNYESIQTSTSSIQKYDRGKAINRTKIFRPLAVARHFLLFAITDPSVNAVAEVM